MAKKAEGGNSTEPNGTLTSHPEEVSTTKHETTVTPPHTSHSHTTVNPGHLTTMTPEELCNSKNASCDACIGAPGAKCLWCNSDSSCKPYPTSKILPPSDMCALEDARWGVCWLNFKAMIIAVAVIGGVLFITITSCCVYCCCCRGGNNQKHDKEDARYNTQKMERKAKSDERKAERKEKLDEIRRKYGLMKDEPYQRFDA